MAEDECPVCFARLVSTIRTRPPCGHEICLECLLSLRKPRCVICRAELDLPRRPIQYSQRRTSVQYSPRAGLDFGGHIFGGPIRRPPTISPDVEQLLALAAQPDRMPLLRPVIATHDVASGAPPVVAEYTP